MTRLSVILSCHIKSPWLAEALASILDSGYHFRDAEFLVCDDASPDGGVSAMAAEFQSRRPGLLRVLRNEKNLGVVGSFSRLIDECRGDYLMFFDYDDVFINFDIDGCMAYLDAHPETAAVYGKKRLFNLDGDKNESHGGDYSAFMTLTAPCPVTNAMILRLADVRAAGGVLPMQGSGWDIYLWLRLGVAKNFVFDDSYRCFYRHHDRQLTRQNHDRYQRDYQFLTQWTIERHPEVYDALKTGAPLTITSANRNPCVMLAGRIVQREEIAAEQKLNILNAVEQVMPEDYSIYEYRAKLYAALGRHAEAMAEYCKMLALFRDRHYIELCALGGILGLCGKAGIDPKTFNAIRNSLTGQFFALTPSQKHQFEEVVANYKRHPEPVDA